MIKLLPPALALSLFALVLSAQDATRGSALYKQQCATCHGDSLQGRSGPPLTGGDFKARWPAPELTAKIKNTMPADAPGKLTATQAADLAAHIQQTGQSAPATTSATPASGPVGNLNQLMRGVMFPNSNIIFTVQSHDPAEKKKAGDAATADGGFNWSQWGTDLYSGWEIVDYAAIALADTAPLLLTPGRRCQNGKLVPVDDPDWIRFTKELEEVGRSAYRASQARNQEKVSDLSGDVADACAHCHQVFRDRFGRGGRGGRGGPAPGGAPGGGADLRCTKN
jgi:cytochrome c553